MANTLLWNKTHTRSVEASRVKKVEVYGDSAYRKNQLWWQVVGWLDDGNNFDFGFYRTLPPAQRARDRLNEQRHKAASIKPSEQKATVSSKAKVPWEERVERKAANVLFGWVGKKKASKPRAKSRRRVSSRAGSIRRR